MENPLGGPHAASLALLASILDRSKLPRRAARRPSTDRDALLLPEEKVRAKGTSVLLPKELRMPNERGKKKRESKYQSEREKREGTLRGNRKCASQKRKKNINSEVWVACQYQFPRRWKRARPDREQNHIEEGRQEAIVVVQTLVFEPP
jgi:hypothetical protein